MAEIINDKVGGDFFKIESVKQYPTSYEELLEEAGKEEETPPEIANTLENIDQYDTIFLGYPIWNGDIPPIIKVFLNSYDFSGKTIIPFSTHGGSGLAGTEQTIKELCPDSTIEEGLAIRGSTAQNNYEITEDSVIEWLSNNGLYK